MKKTFFILNTLLIILPYSLWGDLKRGDCIPNEFDKSLTRTNERYELTRPLSSRATSIWIKHKDGTIWLAVPDEPENPELTSGSALVSAFIYNTLGFKTPVTIFSCFEGKRHVLSKKLDTQGLRQTGLEELDIPQNREIFPFAVYLKDVFRNSTIEGQNNNFVDKNNNIILFSFRGTLGSSQSKMGYKVGSWAIPEGKKWDPSIGYIDPDETGEKMFSEIPLEKIHAWRLFDQVDAKNSLERLNKLTDTRISHAIDMAHYALPETKLMMKEILTKRRETLKNYLLRVIKGETSIFGPTFYAASNAALIKEYEEKKLQVKDDQEKLKLLGDYLIAKKRLAGDVISTAAIRNYLKTEKKIRLPNVDKYDPLLKEYEKEITPLNENMLTYHWTKNSEEVHSFMNLMKNRLNYKYAFTGWGAHSRAVSGLGIYVSETFYGSSVYGDKLNPELYLILLKKGSPSIPCTSKLGKNKGFNSFPLMAAICTVDFSGWWVLKLDKKYFDFLTLKEALNLRGEIFERLIVDVAQFIIGMGRSLYGEESLDRGKFSENSGNLVTIQKLMQEIRGKPQYNFLFSSIEEDFKRRPLDEGQLKNIGLRLNDVFSKAVLRDVKGPAKEISMAAKMNLSSALNNLRNGNFYPNLVSTIERIMNFE